MHPTHHLPSTAEAADLTPAEILRAAALYLSRHGWTQGSYYAIRGSFDGVTQTYDANPTPPACALGAIVMACYGQPIDDPYDCDRPQRWDLVRTVRFFTDYLDIRPGDADPDPTLTDLFDPDVASWNDQPGRTAEQVITALTAAADEWDRIHTPAGGAR